MKTVIIGAGNVAWHLSKALNENGFKIGQVYSKSDSSAKALAHVFDSEFTTDLNQLIPDADFYLIAVRDEAVHTITEQIQFLPKLVAHTSGSIDLSVFGKKFTSFGVMYPLQTFSKNIPIDLKNVPFCIEGNTAESTTELKKIASALSGNVIELDSLQRSQVHLAAVFANNFSNHLYTIAGQLLREKNIPADLLNPLILETAQKAIKTSPESAQTGPAKRSDSMVIDKHLQLLLSYPEYKELYRLFSDSILSRYGKSL